MTTKSKRQKKDHFNRPQAKHQPKETMLIICEGQTEKYYFINIKKEYRLSGVTVEQCPKGTDPKNIIKYAIDYSKNSKAVDKIYCVFDKDNRSTYDQAIKQLKDHKLKNRDNIYPITSVPCFELWLLLHFTYTDKPSQTPKQMEKDLRNKKHLPNYEKKSTLAKNWFKKVHEKTEIALENAKKLQKYNEENNTDDPSTKIHELIDQLNINR